MKALKCIAMLVFLSQLSDAADWTKVRRIAQAASCAASIFDARTTADAAHHGAIESNPLLGNGRPDMARIVGIKVGFCAAQIGLSEWRHRVSNSSVREEKVGAVTAFGTTALFTGAAFHNIGVENALKNRQ